MIVSGGLAPGTRIIERDLARHLDVSRTPVRSALQRLQLEGYVTATSGEKQARLSVAPLTIADAHELFSIVANVEGLAARRAAELDDDARASLAAALRATNADLLRATETKRPDAKVLFELDLDFHRMYVTAAAGPRLLVLHDAIKPQLDRYNRLYMTALARELPTSVDEHEEIIQEIGGGSPERAEHAVRQNFRNAAERISVVIAAVGERGIW